MSVFKHTTVRTEHSLIYNDRKCWTPKNKDSQKMSYKNKSRL